MTLNGPVLGVCLGADGPVLGGCVGVKGESFYALQSSGRHVQNIVQYSVQYSVRTCQRAYVLLSGRRQWRTV